MGHREPRKFVGYSHDLLLVKHHAESLFQNRLKSWVQILNRLTVPTVYELGDVFHRTWSVEGYEGDKMLKPIGFQFPEKFPPASFLHLKDTDGVTFAEHFVGLRVIKGQVVQVNLNAIGFLDKFNGATDDG